MQPEEASLPVSPRRSSSEITAVRELQAVEHSLAFVGEKTWGNQDRITESSDRLRLKCIYFILRAVEVVEGILIRKLSDFLLQDLGYSYFSSGLGLYWQGRIKQKSKR